MKYCHHCGRKVKENDTYCVACGRPLAKPIEEDDEVRDKYVETDEKESDVKKSHGESKLVYSDSEIVSEPKSRDGIDQTAESGPEKIFNNKIGKEWFIANKFWIAFAVVILVLFLWFAWPNNNNECPYECCVGSSYKIKLCPEGNECAGNNCAPIITEDEIGDDEEPEEEPENKAVENVTEEVNNKTSEDNNALEENITVSNISSESENESL